MTEALELVKLKYLKSNKLQYGANESSDRSVEGEPRYIRITDLNENGSLREDTLRTLPFEVAKPYLLCDGDILLARSGATVGKSFIYSNSLGEACFAGYLIRLRVDKSRAFSKFVWYYTQSSIYEQEVDLYTIQATIQNVSAERYGDFRVPFPPVKTQISIAHFLDHKTAAIDTLIEKKQRLIQLLEEKRTALINQAVTQGLDPDAPMKDSGIPWIGRIPKHWEIRRLKFISPSQTVGVVVNPSSYVEDNGVIPFILGSNISEGKINIQKVRRISKESNSLLSKSMLRAGDLVCVRVGEPGVTAVVPKKLDRTNCASVMIVRQSNNFDSDWLCYAMNSSSGKANIALVAYGAAQKQYNISHAIDFLYPFPPKIEEQKNIVSVLKRRLKQLSMTCMNIRIQIKKLQEYRQSLITAAVTGKLDIPEAEADV